MKNISRKDFLKFISILTGTAMVPGVSFPKNIISTNKLKLGLVTYLWGKDWDIPTLIQNCTKAGILGVELRIDHAHGVNIDMTSLERAFVKKQFAESKVEVLGMGTNQQFDYPDQNELRKSIEVAKEYVKLSHDIGGSGVKVKPNKLHKEISKEKTLEQIGKSINELAKYAEDFGQQIRLEVHGRETQELPNIKTIMDYAENPNATVCWNSNAEDLIGNGLEYNFNLVKNRLGDTIHVREFNVGDYPYQQLMNQLKEINYNGWILLECRTNPEDKVKALIEQRVIWEKMITKN
ncbi:MAG: TIM barrel protein [Ignavibacteriae bacterium]|nr:TIM barrel protein [Ignavibacteriota bacterium]